MLLLTDQRPTCRNKYCPERQAVKWNKRRTVYFYQKLCPKHLKLRRNFWFGYEYPERKELKTFSEIGINEKEMDFLIHLKRLRRADVRGNNLHYVFNKIKRFLDVGFVI